MARDRTALDPTDVIRRLIRSRVLARLELDAEPGLGPDGDAFARPPRLNPRGTVRVIVPPTGRYLGRDLDEVGLSALQAALHRELAQRLGRNHQFAGGVVPPLEVGFFLGDGRRAGRLGFDITWPEPTQEQHELQEAEAVVQIGEREVHLGPGRHRRLLRSNGLTIEMLLERKELFAVPVGRAAIRPIAAPGEPAVPHVRRGSRLALAGGDRFELLVCRSLRRPLPVAEGLVLRPGCDPTPLPGAGDRSPPGDAPLFLARGPQELFLVDRRRVRLEGGGAAVELFPRRRGGLAELAVEPVRGQVLGLGGALRCCALPLKCTVVLAAGDVDRLVVGEVEWRLEAMEATRGLTPGAPPSAPRSVVEVPPANVLQPSPEGTVRIPSAGCLGPRKWGVALTTAARQDWFRPSATTRVAGRAVDRGVFVPVTTPLRLERRGRVLVIDRL